MSPLLRKYVDSFVSNLYNSLVSSNSIDTQGYNGYLKRYPLKNGYFLNYRSIYNNNWINNTSKRDYRVKSHVDLSKLFLQPHMALYSAFDESCDSSALLGLLINIRTFPPAVQANATKVYIIHVKYYFGDSLRTI